MSTPAPQFYLTSFATTLAPPPAAPKGQATQPGSQENVKERGPFWEEKQATRGPRRCFPWSPSPPGLFCGIAGTWTASQEMSPQTGTWSVSPGGMAGWRHTVPCASPASLPYFLTPLIRLSWDSTPNKVRTYKTKQNNKII